MKKLCSYVIISLTFAVQHVSADTAEIQRMLNLLGFEAGTADGIYGNPFSGKRGAYFGPIAVEAEKYCRKFWNASVSDVVYGRATEPDDGVID